MPRELSRRERRWRKLYRKEDKRRWKRYEKHWKRHNRYLRRKEKQRATAARHRSLIHGGLGLARTVGRYVANQFEQPYVPRGGLTTQKQVYQTTAWGLSGQRRYDWSKNRDYGPNSRTTAAERTFVPDTAAWKWAGEEAKRRNRNYLRELNERETALKEAGHSDWIRKTREAAAMGLEAAGYLATLYNAIQGP